MTSAKKETILFCINFHKHIFYNRQEQTSLLNHCLSTQRWPHARPRGVPRALFSFTNNTVDKEYNQSYFPNNQSYYQNNQSYSKTIQSYQSYGGRSVQRNTTVISILEIVLEGGRAMLHTLVRPFAMHSSFPKQYTSQSLSAFMSS